MFAQTAGEANAADNIVEMFANLRVEEANDAESPALEEFRALLVATCSTGRSVCVAVEFDDQHRIVRDKIGNVGADCGLASELDAFDLTPIQPVPERALGRRHSAAELSASFDGFAITHSGARAACSEGILFAEKCER
jgi:hypothetical protein